MDKIENPRNIFCYLKRSNRTLRVSVKKAQEESERAHGKAVEIIIRIDLPTNIKYRQTAGYYRVY